MSGFHESLDAALGRAGERDARDDLADAFYESVSWDDLIDGRWIHDPHGLCGHLANLAAQRIEQAKAEERERIASAIEADELARPIDGLACTIELDVFNTPRDEIEDLINRLAEFIYGGGNEAAISASFADSADPFAQGMTRAARIAREVPQ